MHTAASRDARARNSILDTDAGGRTDAFNPAELFLAAIAACMIKGIERATPILDFKLRSVVAQASRRPAGQASEDGFG